MQISEKTAPALSIENAADFITGWRREVPLLNGSSRQYVNFDNAASTPGFQPVLDKVNEFMEWYSSIHRGTGFKSQLCSEVYDQAREVVAEFVHADPAEHAVIFVKNTTEAINKLAHRFHFKPDEVVLTSQMEHHSNDLPWRKCAPKVEHVAVLADGQLDRADLVQRLAKYEGKVALVALTGAANVTGWVNDVHEIAQICHEHHTPLLVDAAQLAPHRRIDMKPLDDPAHIDFLAFSAHKMYAPYGSGVLIGPQEFFNNGDPDHVGGGTVTVVSLEKAVWTDAPEKEEAGTPNTVGVVALAKTILLLQEIGMEQVAEHERVLTRYALEQMREIPGLTIYGRTDPEITENRLGVIAFNVNEMPHAQTAAILNYEGGIAVRNGCFCAHPYIKILLGLSEEESLRLEQEMLQGDRSNLPGAVRASFGIYNTTEEIDHFIQVLKRVAGRDYQGDYELNRERGEYHPRGYRISYNDYFRL
ncbi:MAG: aminotransferase class V-fold PLP-dependent enzyme [Calditrichia bacterium]